jgi:hypothetical protein
VRNREATGRSLLTFGAAGPSEIKVIMGSGIRLPNSLDSRSQEMQMNGNFSKEKEGDWDCSC